MKTLKSGNAININETIKKLEDMHGIVCSLNFNSSLERDMFFMLNRSFEDMLIKAEDKVHELSNNDLISQREWRILIDKLQKLEK